MADQVANFSEGDIVMIKTKKGYMMVVVSSEYGNTEVVYFDDNSSRNITDTFRTVTLVKIATS
jgi:hypothetical protein